MKKELRNERRFLQYFQLPEQEFFLRYLESLALFIYSAISRGTPSDV